MSEADPIPATAVTPIGQAPVEDALPVEQSTADKAKAFVREHPVLLVAGGLVLGAAAAALLRGRSGNRRTTGSLARRAAVLAATAGEIGLTLSRQARDTAEHAAIEGRKRISHDSALVRERAARLAQDARGTGRRLADEVRRLASRQTH